jgi:L-seryl-tRNA(Ser) seleniumtransferase
MPDPRRLVPRTDTVLADPRIVEAGARLSPAVVLAAVREAQARARSGEISPGAVADEAVAGLPHLATSLRPVLNATGVVLHTNLGRAPLSPSALTAVLTASAYVDVEFDIETGARARRGRGTLEALREVVPQAGDVLVVNNGAAALVLATTALATGREVIVSRGEMVEIGDGFRLPDLIASTGARLREVGTTNRTSLRDYTSALGPDTGCVLKVHPSNFRVDGFTSSVTVAELADLPVPVVVDIGSGLLSPDALLPEEPDAATTLADGADLVTCSGDKLLGGPQAGLILGRADLIEQLRRHPLARAVRVDKLTLAALEATLRGSASPTTLALHYSPAQLRERCERLRAGLLAGQPEMAALGPDVVPSSGAVGGGGAPGLELPGWAVSLPSTFAAALRRGDPSVVCRVERGRTLVDLRCIPESDDDTVLMAIRSVAMSAAGGSAPGKPATNDPAPGESATNDAAPGKPTTDDTATSRSEASSVTVPEDPR